MASASAAATSSAPAANVTLSSMRYLAKANDVIATALCSAHHGNAPLRKAAQRGIAGSIISAIVTAASSTNALASRRGMA